MEYEKIMKLYETNSIGEHCLLDSSIKMGTNNKIGKYCKIGSNSAVKGNNTIDDYVTIVNSKVADDCKFSMGGKIFHCPKIAKGARVGSFAEVRHCELSADSTIGSLTSLYKTHVGENSIVLGDCDIDDAQIGAETLIGETCDINRGVKIGDFVTIGNNVVIGTMTEIADGVSIGYNVKIGKNARIIHDVPDNTKIPDKADVDKMYAEVNFFTKKSPSFTKWANFVRDAAIKKHPIMSISSDRVLRSVLWRENNNSDFKYGLRDLFGIIKKQPAKNDASGKDMPINNKR
ncbi:MAG: hypothetical protein LBM38_04580 [Clostridiales bacterium]|jgi:UDP-3-O-[3-hydroxymyristoyl] glucosamine N-acyltransferase|nr:hypothetical protein [Clostridiales bacterium]